MVGYWGTESEGKGEEAERKQTDSVNWADKTYQFKP